MQRRPLIDTVAPKILWDLDGVLSFTSDAVLADLQRRGKLLGATVEHITDWDWVWAQPEVSIEEVWATYLDPAVLASAKPNPSALAAMKWAKSRGYCNEVVTGRRMRDGVQEETTAWLVANAFWPLIAKLSFVPAGYKAAYAVMRGHVIPFEDHAPTAAELTLAVTHSILVDYAYNHQCLSASGRQPIRSSRHTLDLTLQKVARA